MIMGLIYMEARSISLASGKSDHMLHTVVGWSVWPYDLYLEGSWAVLTTIVAEAEESAVYTLGHNLVDLDGDSPEGRLQRK